jgi:flagellar basal body-associated protein FliL
MRRTVLSRFRSAPLVSSALVTLLVVAVAFWRHEGRPPTQVARLSNLQAKLNDGECEFSADIELAGRWARFSFGMRESSVRSALIDVLRSKSRYMVSSRTAREALRNEMLGAVNGVIGDGRATDLRLPLFDLL